MQTTDTLTGHTAITLVPPDPDLAVAAPKPPLSAKTNILIVDDRADKLLALEAILSSLGQNLVKARSGKEALRHLLQQDFAVILLDVSMPCMDGFETASLIRKRPSTEHTPIIFITSISSSDLNISKGYSLGAVDYILTPIVPEVLRSKVAVFVELHKQSDEIKSLNAELQRRIKELTEINKELEGFSYSISHDLRAPLRSIRSFSQFLREHSETGLDCEGKDYLCRIERAAKYMDLLLLDLLQYSRLSSVEIELVSVDLESAVRDVVSSIEQEVQDRNARIDVRQPLGSVLGHPATVRQVLYNLISNSLKFVRPNKSPLIEIWSEPQNGSVRVWVSDQGIGIAPQHHTKIFGLFQRLHSHETYPGTGVGLALVRKGVERMGGHLGLESQPSQGSRFWFELPAPSLAEET
jgi:two-component system sensor histidine kinase/response regulator